MAFQVLGNLTVSGSSTVEVDRPRSILGPVAVLTIQRNAGGTITGSVNGAVSTFINRSASGQIKSVVITEGSFVTTGSINRDASNRIVSVTVT